MHNKETDKEYIEDTFTKNLKEFIDSIGEGIELSGKCLGETIITICISTNKIIKAFGFLVMSLKNVYYTWVGLIFLMVLIYGSLGG